MYIRRPCGCRCVQYSILGGKAQGVRAIFLRQWNFSFLVGQGRVIPRPAGACPLRSRLTLPPLYPVGGLPSLSPATPAFGLLYCPHPPDPRSQSALPGGKGETKVFLCKGLRPLHPRGLRPGGAGMGWRLTRPEGGLKPGVITNSRKVLGGSGDSFKSPPALLRPHPRGLGDSFKSPPAFLPP